MVFEIVEHASEYEDRVCAFNDRMKRKGSNWAFYVHPVPKWLPKKGKQSIWRQFYLALDDQKEVRGGYCLKRQAFWFNGRVQQIASFQGPVSEGLVDGKYSLVAVRMLRDMLAKEPNLFAYGSNENVTKLLRAGKWWISYTPLCLKVVKPYRFLRLNRVLRKSAFRNWILDSLAFSGLGWIGLKSLTLTRKSVYRCPLDSEYDLVDEFGDWSDELWLRARRSYGISAVRDQEALNLLMPKDGWPPVIRLKIRFLNEIIGAAAVLDTPMHNDSRFGSLRVGAIVENFGLLEHCGRITAAAVNLLEQRGVDLIVSNQTHPSWLRGFRANGFQVLKDRRVLALSPCLKQQWGATEALLQGLHMNNLDGDGPLGLASTRQPG